ncbi:hypothetical protein V3C99_013341 [Haemonchus contortus]|uniref:Phage tail protein n=1 Tax=Haemonchus contortus TaxID=6289 RepID=A0A7I4Y341_HAECO
MPNRITSEEVTAPAKFETVTVEELTHDGKLSRVTELEAQNKANELQEKNSHREREPGRSTTRTSCCRHTPHTQTDRQAD